MEGQSLDRYDVLEKVGEGGMATVYRGHHRTLGREVALKVLHPHLSGVERNRQRFEREAKAIEILRHPNIVEIFDYSGQGSDDCFIVMEFIKGVTLKAWLETDTLPSEIAASIGVALCDALHYAHGCGIVHRDIKPENVMLRPDGLVKLMDFGIARVLDDSKVTMTGGLVGSPAYMSPEQALDGEIGPQSDQFSLGILLYRSVTGHLPFVGKSPPIILKRISEGTYADPEDIAPTIAPDLAAIIRRALEQDPRDRFPNTQAMGEALRQVLKDAKTPYTNEERARYIEDPEAYTLALSTHVMDTQLIRAKALLGQGETAQAMAILGRLLAIDDGNEEILALLSQLHKVPNTNSMAPAAWALLLLVPLGVIAFIALRSDTPSLTEPPPPLARSTAAGDKGNAPSQGAPTPIPTTQRVVALGVATPSPSPEAAPPTLTPPPRSAIQKATVESIRRRPRPRSAKATPTPTPTPKAVAALPGTLDLQSNPWAEIFVDGSRIDSDGRAYGNTLRAQPISLEPGRHTLRLVNPRCAPLETEITIDPGQILRRRFKVCPRLTILGLDPEDTVEVNGEGVNLNAPILLTATPEVHEVAVTKGDGSRILRRIAPDAPQGPVILDLRLPGDGS